MRSAAALVLVLATGCTQTVSEVHARAVQDYLLRLSQASQKVADDAPRHPQCIVGDSPVSVRAATVNHDLRVLSTRADKFADGSWPSREAFSEAMSETAGLQTKLAILRAEYDACRALKRASAEPRTLAPGIRRLAVLQIQEAGTGITTKERETLDRHLSARLGTSFRLVDPVAVRQAQQQFEQHHKCETHCALAVARAVGAHKALALRLRRTEDRCEVILEVYDMSTGATERARTVRNDCSMASIMAGLEDAISPLAPAPEPR